MAKNSSYANENVIRNLNLIDFTLPTSKYSTVYVDVSKYNNFIVLGSSSSTLVNISVHHNVDGSGPSNDKELIEFLPAFSLTGVLQNLGTFSVKSRFLRIEINDPSPTLSTITLQLLFREAPLSSGGSSLVNVGAGIPLYDNAGGIKTLTSNDSSVIITDNTVEVDLSTSAGGLPTVGTTNADYTTIFDAVSAGVCNMRVINNTIENNQINLNTLGCRHLRIEIGPEVQISNSILGTTSLFFGSSSKLILFGSGSGRNYTSPLVVSGFILNTDQPFISGPDMELTAYNVDFNSTGGTNNYCTGLSQFFNCKFLGSTLADLGNFTKRLKVDGCYFICNPRLCNNINQFIIKDATIINSYFINITDIIADGTTGFIFKNNVIEQVVRTDLIIQTYEAGNIIIQNNTFLRGSIILNNSSFFDKTSISNNIWKDQADANINITTLILRNSNITENVLGNISITGDIQDVVIADNTAEDNLVINGLSTTSNISDNTITGNLEFNDATVDSVISDNTCNIITYTLNGPNNSNITGNTVINAMDISGAINNTNIINNNCQALTINDDTTDSNITGNTVETLLLDGNLNLRLVVNSNKITEAPPTISFTITGIVAQSSITGNDISSGFSCTLDFNNSTFGNNKVAFTVPTSPIEFLSNINESVIDGNVGLAQFRVGASSESIFSNNQFKSILISTNCIDSNILGNLLNRSSGGNALQINGTITRSIIMNNSSSESFQFGDPALSFIAINNGKFDKNLITNGSIAFNARLRNSTINDNYMTGNISLTSSCFRSSVSDNKCVRISIDTTNNNVTTECTFSRNILNGAQGLQIGSGSGGANGTSSCIVNDNITPSIGAVLSNGDNIITSNRCPSITGFSGGLGDIIAANQ